MLVVLEIRPVPSTGGVGSADAWANHPHCQGDDCGDEGGGNASPTQKTTDLWPSSHTLLSLLILP